MNGKGNAVITVLGQDRKGIIARVTTLLYKHNVNIVDISQTILVGGMFSMVLIGDISDPACDFADTSAALSRLGAEMGGIEIQIRRSEIFEAMNEV